MKNILTPELVVALAGLLVVLIGGLTTWVSNALKKKADKQAEQAATEEALAKARLKKKYISIARDTLMDIVHALQETTVKVMRKANGGELTKDDIQKLKYETISTLKAILPLEVLEFLENSVEDFDGWVQVVVDAAIYLLKNNYLITTETLSTAEISVAGE